MSRKRTLTLEVDNLIDEIKTTSKTPQIFDRLQSYDQVIKKYKIDPLNEVALEIYEYFVEEETLNSMPSKSRVRHNKLKFSRNAIDLEYSSESDIRSKSEMEDPECYNQNLQLYSFSKGPRPDTMLERQLQPHRLFQNKSLKNSCYPSSKSSSSNLSRYQMIESNSKQQKHRNESQFAFKKERILKLLRFKYFSELLQLFENKKRMKLRQSHHQKVKSLYEFNILKRAFCSLLQNLEETKSKCLKADQFQRENGQSMLENYFSEWAYWTHRVPQEQKSRLQQIPLKSEKLSKWFAINSLKTFQRETEEAAAIKNSKKEALFQKQIIVAKQNFMNSLKSKCESLHKIKRLQQEYKVQQWKHIAKLFVNRMTTFCEESRNEMDQKIQRLRRFVYGKRLIQSLRNQQSFMETYWQNYQTPQRLIFMKLFLSAVKHRLLRLGYRDHWISELDENLEFTDKKHKCYLSQRQKRIAFNGLKQWLKSIRSKQVTVKRLIAMRVLKCLSNNLDIAEQKQVQHLKVQQIIDLRYENACIHLVQNGLRLPIQDRESQVKKYRTSNQINEFFRYLESNKLLKQHYRRELQDFKQKWRHIWLEQLFFAFRKVIKEQILNEKLVQEYLELKSAQITSAIFAQLKNNVFIQKLHRSKLTNLNRFLVVKHFDQFVSQLRAQHRREKQAVQISKATEKVKQLLVAQAFSSFYVQLNKKTLENDISSILMANYKLHILRKCFVCWKIMGNKYRKQGQLYRQIKIKKQQKTKEKIFEIMVEGTLKATKKRRILELFNDLKQGVLKQT